jgi:hypothetical protein
MMWLLLQFVMWLKEMKKGDGKRGIGEREGYVNIVAVTRSGTVDVPLCYWITTTSS